MFKYILIVFMIPNIAFAEVIFKCTEGENVSYVTFKNNRPNNSSCISTDIGNDNYSPISKEIKTDKKISDLQTQSSIAKPVSFNTQQKRDDTRSKILQQELDAEKKLLSDLITKSSNTKIPEDLKEINVAIGNHNNNIKALNKALGIK